LTRPNILFFFTDDQRFDTIAALGNQEIQTPNIDQLVRNGTTFTHAHIPGGTVGAVCMPSRAMLHTGKTLFHLEQNGGTIPTDHLLLGEALQQAGYRTYGTGKWHNGTEAYARSFTDGDEIFFGGMHDHWNVPVCHYDPTGQYKANRNVIEQPMKNNIIKKQICDHVHAGKHSSELFCEAAIKWIQQYDSHDPFFMYISFMAPHDPRSVPQEYLDMYNPEDIQCPPNFMEQHPFDFGVSDIRDEVLAPYPRTEQEIKKHIAEYYAMITHLDHELGKVITTLKESGRFENTIIVLAGDNGLGLGQHGLLGKQNLYEHSVRVPLIFSGPGIPVNERRDAYVYLLDIYPTLCELIHVDIPESVEGISLVPAMQDAGLELRDSLYLAYSRLIRGVKNRRYKLIEYRNDALEETQLFDLQNDPHELHNLFNQEGYEALTLELKKQLQEKKDLWDDLSHPLGQSFWNKY